MPASCSRFSTSCTRSNRKTRTCCRAGQHPAASLVFARAISSHPGTDGAARARLHLAVLGQHILRSSGDHPPAWAWKAAIRNAHGPALGPAQIQGTLRQLASSHTGSSLGSEALYHLGAHFEWMGDRSSAIQAYEQLTARLGQIPSDPWPEKGAKTLKDMLKPWIAAALQAQDAWTAMALFHRLGPAAEDAYATSTLPPDLAVFGDRVREVAELARVHREWRFSARAVKLYQALIRSEATRALREDARMGLGRAYLDQEDYPAARRVFEQYRLQYPLGRWKRDALLLLAEALDKEGNPDRVIITTEKWLKRYPQHRARPRALLLLGKALAEKGQIDRALRFYGQASLAGALDTVARQIRYADLLAKGRRPGDAAVWYRRALQSAPDVAEAEWARVGLATALVAQKRYTQGNSVLNELELFTDDDAVKRFTVAARGELSRLKPPNPAATTSGRARR